VPEYADRNELPSPGAPRTGSAIDHRDVTAATCRHLREMFGEGKQFSLKSA